MQVVKLSQKNIKDLESFCYECKLLGYQNNATLKDLKWGDYYDLPSIPEYWAVYKDDKIIHLAGCHQFEPNSRTLRCLFRAATLPEYLNIIKGLSRNHMNSLGFSYMLPEQITYGLENGYDTFVITTNSLHDFSGRMNKTHRALQLIADNNIVEYLGDREYFHIPQSIWRVNLPEYFSALETFRKHRSSDE